MGKKNRYSSSNIWHKGCVMEPIKEVQDDMEDYNCLDMIQIAKRYQNQKRSYLLVNRCQAKHIPVSPEIALYLFQQLGCKIKEKYPSVHLVIGFSETATALGFGVAQTLGNSCIYITTTRELTEEDKDCLFFSEEHSHASEQKLYIKTIQPFLELTDAIAIVDDEISTGNTIRNFIRQMRQQMPCVKRKKIIVATILNRISKESEYEFQKENIYFESIFRAFELRKETDSVESFLAPSKKFLNQTSSKPNYIQLHFENARKPIPVSAYFHNCEALTAEIQNKIHFAENEKVLFLGTEECMYPAIYAAKRIGQLYPVKTYCYATTRSPICIYSEKKYPIQNGYQILSLYEKGRVNYIYNLRKYDMAILLSDSNFISAFSEALSVLDAVLASYNIRKRYYFLGGK